MDSFIQRSAVPMIVITIAINIYRIVFLYLLPNYAIYSNPEFRPYFIKLMVVSDTFTGIFYLWLIGWSWYKIKLKFLLKPLRYVGRMALSNYIMQSLIGLFLFSSIGMALYETLSPVDTLLIAIAVFFVKIIISKIWLSYFRFGPLEWLWRCFTYKKILPIKKKKIHRAYQWFTENNQEFKKIIRGSQAYSILNY